MNILLVEDNRSDAELLTELLAETDGAPTIEWVRDGQQAINYLHRKDEYSQAARPDLVLLDLGLPRVSGHEVLKTIRNRPELATIHVYVLTTSANPADRSECEAVGVDAFITKPRNLQEYEKLAEKIASGRVAQ